MGVKPWLGSRFSSHNWMKLQINTKVDEMRSRWKPLSNSITIRFKWSIWNSWTASRTLNWALKRMKSYEYRKYRRRNLQSWQIQRVRESLVKSKEKRRVTTMTRLLHWTFKRFRKLENVSSFENASKMALWDKADFWFCHFFWTIKLWCVKLH